MIKTSKQPVQQPLQQTLQQANRARKTAKQQPLLAGKNLAKAKKADTLTLSASGLAKSKAVKAAKTPSAAAPTDYTNNIKLTGDKNIDALLAAGNHWWHGGTSAADGANPSASADHALTYSFIASATGLSAKDGTGFQTLGAAQRDVVRAAFSYLSSVVNISFSEDTSGNGVIRLGSNQQGGASGGYASYPNDSGSFGKVFIANDLSAFSNAASWEKGGYEWETLIHEIGHALGLKHPGNYNAGGGGTPGPYLTRGKDNHSHSIMSYNDDKKQMRLVEATSQGSLKASNVNPDSYQLLDIAALQYLYGAPDNATPTTYTFDDDETFLKSIYDSNPGSKIDLSGMTQDNVVDLRGGKRSAIGIRDPFAATGMTKEEYLAAKSGGTKLSKLLGVPSYSGTDNLGIAKGSRIQTAIGGSGDDVLISGSEIGGTAQLDGGQGDDKFFIASGNAQVSDTGGSNDSLYVVKKTKTQWMVDADQTTLTQTDKKTGGVLATVNIDGIENVGFWNGKKAKATGKPLYSAAAPANLKAYAAKPKATQKVNVHA